MRHLARRRANDRVQPETVPAPRPLDLVERRAGGGRQRHRVRIMPERRDRAVATVSDLTAGVQHPRRIRGVLHMRERRSRFEPPYAIHQRRPQPAIAMLAR